MSRPITSAVYDDVVTFQKIAPLPFGAILGTYKITSWSTVGDYAYPQNIDMIFEANHDPADNLEQVFSRGIFGEAKMHSIAQGVPFIALECNRGGPIVTMTIDRVTADGVATYTHTGLLELVSTSSRAPNGISWQARFWRANRVCWPVDGIIWEDPNA